MKINKSDGQQKSLKCSTWVQSQKWQKGLCFQGKPFYITLIQVCAPISSAKEAEVEWFYDHLQDLLELTPKKCPFHHRGLERKSWRSSNTWSDRRVWLWSTKWSRAKANWVLPRERTGHSKQPLPNTTRDNSKLGHQHMVDTEMRLILFFAAEALYSQQKQDQELTVSQIMNSLLQNSDLNWRKYGIPLEDSGMT